MCLTSVYVFQPIGTPPLFYAMDRDHVPTAAYLIEKGADITLCDFTGYSPLHIAAERGVLLSGEFTLILVFQL